MRTIRVEERDSGHTLLWLSAGALLGLGLGVLVAERRSGRTRSGRTLLARGRGLASMLLENIGPLLETARGLQDAWAADPAERDEDPEVGAGDEEPDEELDDDLDEDLDEDDGDDEDEDQDADEDEDDDEDDDDEDEDEDEEDDDDEAEPDSALDARVLEAFSHDPILAARAVEIEDVGDGDIVLRGRVRSAREVRHAVTMARGVPGITRVREKLAIIRPR